MHSEVLGSRKPLCRSRRLSIGLCIWWCSECVYIYIIGKQNFIFIFCFQFPLNWKTIFGLLNSFRFVSVSIFVFRLYIYIHALIRKTEFDVLDLRMKFRIYFPDQLSPKGVWRQFVDKMFISSRQPSFGRLVVHLDASASRFSSSSRQLIRRVYFRSLRRGVHVSSAWSLRRVTSSRRDLFSRQKWTRDLVWFAF
jgi:hypothetical protein